MAVTPEERAVLDHLVAAWSAYLALPVEHPTERQEFCTMIHTLQNMVAARPTWRGMNATWKPRPEEDVLGPDSYDLLRAIVHHNDNTTTAGTARHELAKGLESAGLIKECAIGPNHMTWRPTQKGLTKIGIKAG